MRSTRRAVRVARMPRNHHEMACSKGSALITAVIAGVAALAAALYLLHANAPAPRGSVMARSRSIAANVSHSSKGASAATVLVGWQVGDSQSEADRRRLVGLFKKVSDSVLPEDSHVIMWCFNGASWRIYDGIPGKWAALLLPLQRQVLTSHPRAAHGTSPCQMLHEMIRAVKGARANGGRVAVILCTNGEFSDYEATRSCIRNLTSQDNVAAVWVVGTQPDPGRGEDLRRKIETVFSPLEDRLIVSGEFDATTGFTQFATLMTGEN